MKIAVVIPNYGPVGGAESYAYQLSERLALEDDFDIHVLANRRQSCESRVFFHKIPIISFPRFLKPLSFAYFAQKHIVAGGYDLVHSHERVFYSDIFTFHGIPHATWIRKTKRDKLCLYDRATAWVEEKGINGNRQPLILPVSSLVKDELQDSYAVPCERVDVMTPGVDLERFSRHDSVGCRKRVRERFGITDRDIVLLFVAMNFELKRLALIIKSLAHLVEQYAEGNEVKLLVVGKGNRQRYIKMAQQLGVADRLVFAGVVTEMPEYYFASDIFVMPSQFDTFGMVVLEAMAAGLPVVIGQNVGAKDLVESDRSGLIVSEPPSVAELSGALMKLLDKNARQQIGARGRATALQYGWDRVASQVASLYRELAKTTGRDSRS